MSFCPLPMTDADIRLKPKQIVLGQSAQGFVRRLEPQDRAHLASRLRLFSLSDSSDENSYEVDFDGTGCLVTQTDNYLVFYRRERRVSRMVGKTIVVGAECGKNRLDQKLASILEAVPRLWPVIRDNKALYRELMEHDSGSLNHARQLDAFLKRLDLLEKRFLNPSELEVINIIALQFWSGSRDNTKKLRDCLVKQEKDPSGGGGSTQGGGGSEQVYGSLKKGVINAPWSWSRHERNRRRPAVR